ncbi:MAG TPA: ethanolamine ammonia-lyase reactivating factor EutA [Xanthobacteraceae bacterium]|jgi:ethanolamine utilization protein EutA|nr:ethanolamine ammonia-lyase reactivating factor EutA [Xanthobacteraceae bacterium]
MAEDEKIKAPHSLADHLYGRDLAHAHAGDADHDHDHDFDDAGPVEDNPLWRQDNVTLATVGIDIGSSGTQVIFSRVHLRRLAEDLTSRYYVVARETLFQSPVTLTPYQNEERIDDAKLGAIIDDAYVAAGLPPEEIDTGVVILTGEALRRENAQAIAAILAEKGGEFVTATAGHHMEAMLAAYGSGAARASSDEGKRILNVDIGGGTTKLGLVENGKVVATAAIHIGGRLQVVENGKTVRLDPAGKHHAARAGFAWERGDIIEPADLQKVADTMADTLVAAILTRPLPDDIARLYLTEPIVDLGRIDGVMFSGGVAEYVYAREARDFGDLGQRLGRALRAHIDSGALPWPVLPAGECIRATALGASEYSVQLSGNTSYISAPGRLLPRRNLQVLLPPFICAETIDPDALARAIRNHMTAFDVADTERDIALALRWSGLPSYPRLAAFAEGIRRGLAERIAKKLPLYIMLDGDVAQTLGHLLRDELHIASDLLVIDGVVLWDFDYIDLGRIRMPSYTVPVTIKSLVFSEDPRGPRPRQRLHHREHAHDHVHDHAHAHTHEHHHAPAHEHDHSHEHEHEHDHDHSHGHAHHKRKA